MKSEKVYKSFSKLKTEKEAINSLIETLGRESLSFLDYDWDIKQNVEIPVKTLEDFTNLIVNESDVTQEDVASDYIYQKYSITTNDKKFKFIVIGESFRKDM
jgi:hypothetical protein